MKHRKPCGCLTEIKYEISMRGFKTTTKKLYVCDKHKDNPKLESRFKHKKKKEKK